VVTGAGVAEAAGVAGTGDALSAFFCELAQLNVSAENAIIIRVLMHIEDLLF
jgi:hypothetical protein